MVQCISSLPLNGVFRKHPVEYWVWGIWSGINLPPIQSIIPSLGDTVLLFICFKVKYSPGGGTGNPGEFVKRDGGLELHCF